MSKQIFKLVVECVKFLLIMAVALLGVGGLVGMLIG